MLTVEGLAEAEGDADSLGAADSDAEGVELAEASGLFTCVWSLESVALGVGLLCDWVTAGSIARTGRKFICEDERIRFRVSCEGVPGIDTEIFEDPREEISDSDTPEASIR